MSEPLDDELTRELHALRATQVDVVALRRVRDRLLRSGGAPATRSSHTRYAPRMALAAATIVLLTGGAIIIATHPRAPAPTEPRETPVSESSIAAVESDDAKWTTTIDDAAENIVLDDGTLRLRVSRKLGDRRVIVRVPDGEIEDVGTVFEVSVRDHRTVAVHVDDGRVKVRLAATEPMTLEAGQSWTRPERPSTARRTPGHERPVVEPVAEPATTPVPAAPETRPSEDAAYLAIIHAVRAGDADAAKAHARAYLRDFPDGFRREEVRRFVGDAEDSRRPAPEAP